jgi:hypothetical protein
VIRVLRISIISNIKDNEINMNKKKPPDFFSIMYMGSKNKSMLSSSRVLDS